MRARIGKSIRLAIIAVAAFSICIIETTFESQARRRGLAGIAVGIGIGIAIGSSRRGTRRAARVRTRSRDTGTASASSSQHRSGGGTRAIQQALVLLGFDPGPVDGAMGGQTRDAIKAWQAQQGAEPTGRLTDDQRQSLLSALDSPSPAGGTTAGAQPGGPVEIPADWRQTAKVDGGGTGAAAGDRQLADVCPSEDAPSNGIIQVSVGGAPAPLLPKRFCLVAGTLVTPLAELAEQDGSALSELEATCNGYFEHAEGLLAKLTTLDPAELENAAKASFASDEARSEYASAGQACVGLSIAQGEADAGLVHAMLMQGAGQPGFAELVSEHVALGLGTPEDLSRASTLMGFAASRVSTGAAPIIQISGEAHGETLGAIEAELALRAAAGTSYWPEPSGDRSSEPAPAAPQSVPQAGFQVASLPAAPASPVIESGTAQSVPSGPEIARGAIDAARATAAGEVEQLRAELGSSADEVSAGCRKDAGAIVARQASEGGAIEQELESLKAASGEAGVAGMVPALRYCRALSYVAGDSAGALYYDYLLSLTGRSENAALVAYRFVLGEGIAANREQAFRWLGIAAAGTSDPKRKAQLIEVMAGL